MKRTHRSDDDFRAEIEAHLQLEIDQLVEEGVEPREAEMLARRRFGNVTRTRERFFERNRFMALENLRRSVIFALRQMRRSPVSTTAILLSLALGVGINVSLFSIADRVAFRSLPVQNPETLAQLQWDGTFPVRGMGSVGSGHLIPFPLYERIRDEADSFQEVFARAPAEAHLDLGDEKIPARIELVTGGYFAGLGVRPALGRLLDDSDDVTLGAHPVAVLSHAFWQRQFGGRAEAIGERVLINGVPFTIVGVAEPGFGGTDWGYPPTVYAPMRMVEAITGRNGLDEPRSRFSHVYARLAPGVTFDRAEVELAPWFENYKQGDMEHPSWPSVTEEQLAGFLATKLRVLDGSRGQTRLGEQLQEPIRILIGATVLVFLLACLNVANLSLARVFAARRATALRTALGADRRRLLAESFVESGVFALVGSLAGLVAAPSMARWMVQLVTPVDAYAGRPGLEPGLDVRVLAFAVGTAALVTLLAGVAPAFFAASIRPVEALQQRSEGGAAGLRMRRAMVVGQFALALLLLLGAGLFSQTLRSLRSEGPGYPTTNLLTFQIDPRKDGHSLHESKVFAERLVAQLEQEPDIASAGISAFRMLRGGGWNNPVTVTRTTSDGTRNVPTDRSIPMNAITPNFFGTLQTPVLQGRGFTDADRTGEGWDLRHAVVNQEFVDRYLDGASPIGERLAFGNGPDANPSIEIIGVVQTFRDYGLRESEPAVFFALWERTVGTSNVYVRSTTASSIASEAVRRAVAAVDPSLTMVSLRTIDDQLDRLLINERMLANLASAFAAVAGLLAMIGLYGVLAFSAERRTHEMGIRMALGAPRWSAGGLIVREAITMAMLGVGIAVPLAWVLGQFVQSQLYDVRPLDLSILLGAATALFLLGVLASALPARKIQRVDPLAALRTE